MDAPLHLFRSLKGKHSGEEAWIVGKGASLDLLDPSKMPPLRILLNETVKIVPTVPGHTYWCVGDNAVFWRIRNHKYRPPEGCVGVFKRNYCNEGIAPIFENIAHFWGRDDRLSFDREVVNDRCELYAGRSISIPAIHLAWYMGVERIVMVGCEGSSTYSTKASLIGAHCDTHNIERFESFRTRCQLLLRVLGMTWRYFNEQEEFFTDDECAMSDPPKVREYIEMVRATGIIPIYLDRQVADMLLGG